MNIIQRLRQERGWTQTALASKSSIKVETIRKLETSHNLLNCRVCVLKAIADSMLVPMDYIITEQIKAIVHGKESVQMLYYVTPTQIAVATLDMPNELLDYFKANPYPKIKKALEEQRMMEFYHGLSKRNCAYAIEKNGIIYCQKSCEYCMDENCCDYRDDDIEGDTII